MKTLYLHIGTPKTATSSIQKFLQINRDILGQHGYCFPKQPRKYPNVGVNRNAHFMVEISHDENGVRDTAREMQSLREGLDMVLESFRQYDNVILSEENLWRVSGYSRKEVLPYLRHEAEEQGYQVKIIVYLRRQDQFLASNWNQRVKHTSVNSTQTLEEYVTDIEERRSLVTDYAAKLDSLAELFGKENLIVRRFDPKSWVKQSVIHDFMDCIGLEVTEEFRMPSKQINPGLSGNYAEIKRMINLDSSFDKNDGIYLTKILISLSKESSERYPCSMFSARETKDLLNRYASGNERVAIEYIRDGKPLFSDQISDLPKWEKNNPYMTEDLFRFFTTVYTGLCTENESLKKNIASMRQTASDGQTQPLRLAKKLVKSLLRKFV